MRRASREWQRLGERCMERLLFAGSLSGIVTLGAMVVFTFAAGLPVILRTGLGRFLLGQHWRPLEGEFGIAAMVVGSVFVTLGALAAAVPLGLGTAILLSEFAPPWVRRIARPAVELLAGIPSVVYGFYGLVVIVPLIRQHLGGVGFSILAGSVILAVMILPTLITIALDSLRQVPDSYRQGSLALGATRWQTVRRVVLPAARSGVVAAVVLGAGRAVGETMAVLMVTGNVAVLPESILSPVRTLTGNIALEMGYAAGEHQQALFASGIVLFILTMILNGLIQLRRVGRVAR